MTTENTILSEFLSLKDYIQQTYENILELHKDGLSKEQINELAYESRANLEDLMDELKACIKQLNKSFKINNTAYKAFRANEDALESSASVPVEQPAASS
jgi:non-homologous end joining protein Ku